MKRVDGVSQVPEAARPLSSLKKEETLKPECVARLTARVVGWSVYSSVVWAAVWRFALGDAAATLTVPWILAAVFCVSNGASAFAVSAYFRSRGEIGVGEVFYAIWARTGVFCVVAAAFVVAGEPSALRAGLKALLIAYFATAPLHFAAIFPVDERRLKRWGKRAKKSDCNDCGE
ncbi:MAG: hypothetical protein IJE97_01595 [Thermoguttaceae bacterium]|nr:hypothetical protein [Thermoguttaceae bacterium]MBQ7111340.1 hypothetical protein [Thermoguttaceae bacterium]